MSFYPNEPTFQDIKESGHLVEILDEHEVFDTKADVDLFTFVMGHLEKLGRNWIFREAVTNGMPESQAMEVGGKILTFGSHSLNVHQRGNDIDVILVGPQFVTIGMFFQKFSHILRCDPMVESCLDLPLARIPMIKLIIEGVNIDLLYVSLKSIMVPGDLVKFEARFLLYQDEWDQMILNGLRTTDAILKSLSNDHSFQITLHLVKLWAKRKSFQVE